VVDLLLFFAQFGGVWEWRSGRTRASYQQQNDQKEAEAMKKLFLLGLVLGLMGGLAGHALAEDTIKIGVMGPMTGSWASEGQEMKQVVELLAEDLNARGGVLGKKVTIISEDDGGDPRTAALAAQRLATQGIVAVIGTYGSSVTEATQNIYDESKIIQIANGSTAIRLTEKGLKNFFRTCPRDDEQGLVAAQTIEKLGFKKAAILHDNTTYAKGLADEGKTLLEKKGVKVIFFEALTPGERDYTAILTKLKAAAPDVVFFTGYYPEGGLLLRQKKEMNWNVPFIGGDATNHPDLVKIAGKDAAAGFYFLSAPLPKDLPTEEAKTFLATFTKKYGNPPSSIYAVLAGDGFRVSSAAIEGTKSTETPKMSEYLHTKLKDFPGLTGKISFNEKGDRVGEVYRVYKVDADGSFILQP
jgi:branched-chain amino acid transport system substrate-binding protein